MHVAMSSQHDEVQYQIEHLVLAQIEQDVEKVCAQTAFMTENCTGQAESGWQFTSCRSVPSGTIGNH
jgi:hypothetical protein